MAKYITVQGVQLRYVVKGDTILPEDDNNIVAVIDVMCEKALDLVSKVEEVKKSSLYSML